MGSNNSMVSHVKVHRVYSQYQRNTKPSIVHGSKRMVTHPSLNAFSMPRRRDWLLWAGASWAALPAVPQVLASRGAAVTLPAAQSLQGELAQALKNKQPLVVMVSLEGCVFCHQARQSHLSPMHRAGTNIVQVDMRSNQPVLDFAGKLTTHDELTRRWKVSITPTLLFFGPGGKEVAERMEGAYLPDFYGPYLEERMVQGRKAL
jgi:hypothetical protein